MTSDLIRQKKLSLSHRQTQQPFKKWAESSSAAVRSLNTSLCTPVNNEGLTEGSKSSLNSTFSIISHNFAHPRKFFSSLFALFRSVSPLCSVSSRLIAGSSKHGHVRLVFSHSELMKNSLFRRALMCCCICVLLSLYFPFYCQ